MISRSTRVQLLVFALVTTVGIAYVGYSYAGFPRLLGAGYTVVARFAEAGGVFPRAEVTYRGVGVGQVADIRLIENGVAVRMRIDGDAPSIPADAVAEVHNRSAVGVQYVDLVPQSRGGPYLREGSVIPRERTEIPPQIAPLLFHIDQLLESVPREDLVTVVDELNTAFRGTGPELERLIGSGNQLLRAAEANLPATLKLIEDARTVLETQRETSGAITSFSADLAALTDQLRESDPDLRATLENGVTASIQLTELLRSVRPTLPVLLGNLVATGQVVRMRLPGVEQILVTYPIAVAQSYTTVPGDGTAHFGLVLNLNAPPPCTEGYEETERTYPQNTDTGPAASTAHCQEDDDTSINVRGSRYAPTAGAAARAPAADRGPFVAGYDPASGRTIGPDGKPYILGSLGENNPQAGDRSWKDLLLDPVRR